MSYTATNEELLKKIIVLNALVELWKKQCSVTDESNVASLIDITKDGSLSKLINTFATVIKADNLKSHGANVAMGLIFLDDSSVTPSRNKLLRMEAALQYIQKEHGAAHGGKRESSSSAQQVVRREAQNVRTHSASRTMKRTHLAQNHSLVTKRNR